MVTSCLALQDMPDIPNVLGSIPRYWRQAADSVLRSRTCSDTPFECGLRTSQEQSNGSYRPIF